MGQFSTPAPTSLLTLSDVIAAKRPARPSLAANAARERQKLDETRRRLEIGIRDVGDLSLSPADVELLLELARAAAHESGERTNAPLVSYLVGLAHGRSPNITLDEAVAISLGRDTS